MRCPIPKKMRDQLSKDPFMKSCIVANNCEGRVEFDHAFKYAGRRINELWAILPLCTKHNHGVTKEVQRAREKYLRTRITHFNAESDFRTKYPRSRLLENPAKGVSPN